MLLALCCQYLCKYSNIYVMCVISPRRQEPDKGDDEAEGDDDEDNFLLKG